MKKVLVIGSLNVDFSIQVDSIPKLGETVNSKEISLNCGGKGANQAYTIGKLGGNVSMLGCVGDDSYGKKLKASLKKANVNIRSIIKLKNQETGKAFVCVDKSGQNSIVIVKGSNDLLDESLIQKNLKYINSFDIILMQLEIPINTVKKVLEVVKDKIIILDPAPADSSILDFKLENVYLIKPNETELSTLTGIKLSDDNSIVEAAKILLTKGVKNVLVSLGEKGSLLVNEAETMYFDSIKNNVIDTTAAGDSFIASVALGLSKNQTLKQSIEFATKVSSLVITKKGAQESIPTQKEVDKL